MQLKPEEVTAIGKDFDEPGHLAPTGLFIAGTKYMVIQGEPGAVIRGKKVIPSMENTILKNNSISRIKKLFDDLSGSWRHMHQENWSSNGVWAV